MEQTRVTEELECETCERKNNLQRMPISTSTKDHTQCENERMRAYCKLCETNFQIKSFGCFSKKSGMGKAKPRQILNCFLQIKSAPDHKFDAKF